MQTEKGASLGKYVSLSVIFFLIVLSLILCFLIPLHLGKMGLSFFLSVFALSWWFVYWKKSQLSQVSSHQNETLNTLNSELGSLKQQLSEVQAQAYTEKAEFQQFCIKETQEKEGIIQSLKEKESQCCKLQGQLYVDTSFEPSAEEVLRFEQLEHQHKILKTHFEEKSTALDLARKELFKTEGALHLLQKWVDEESLNPSEEIGLLMRELIRLKEECQVLEAQVETLQALTCLLIPFAKTRLQ